MNSLRVRNWPTLVKLSIGLSIPTLFVAAAALLAVALFTRFDPTAREIDRATFITAMLLVVVAAIVSSLVIGIIAYYFVVRPIRQLDAGIQSLARGEYTVSVAASSAADEISTMIRSVNSLSTQLATEFSDLEKSIAQRTRDLEAARDIGQIVSALRDVNQIANEVIALILQRFDTIYHAQVFLTDPRRIDAVLVASTGEPGRQLLARAHRLEIGSRSVIGSVTARGEPVVALDTENNPIHRMNPLLPETRAELALPMRTSEGVIGALDLQSRLPNAFGEADVRLFQTVADQLSIAIQNARLFEESQSRLRDIEELNRLLMGETWRNFLDSRKRQNLLMISRDDPSLSPLQQRAIQTQTIAEQFTEQMVKFAAPVTLRGQVLGAVEFEVARTRYNENTKVLAAELANRLAIAIDNARLLEESQRAASREYLINEISNKLIQQPDVSRILQTAVRELGQVIPATQTTIQLTGDV